MNKRGKNLASSIFMRNTQMCVYLGNIQVAEIDNLLEENLEFASINRCRNQGGLSPPFFLLQI